MKSDIRHIVYEVGAMGRGGRSEAGVTLVEMLIVLAIITLLASLVIGMATHIDNQSKGKGLQNTFAVLESALEEYRENRGWFPYGGYPDPHVNSERFYAVLNSEAGSRKILEKISDSLIADKGGTPDMLELYDPWGTPLDYRYDANTDTYPELISAGPDKNFGTPDDITSKRK
ncbi:MAG: type II secretion system protein [Planctomycetota bacterium]|jgi:prepilin-type N-terminal cleavage/methylation domain-containing protein